MGHSLLRIADAILLHGGPFRDLGPDHFDERDADHVRRRLTKRLEALGFQVTLEPRTA